MSSNLFSFNLENFSIKTNFLNCKEEEGEIIDQNNYIFSLEKRTNMINWLTFLCTTLNFSNQTLLRSIIIFDQYIYKIREKEIEEMTQNKLNLITIACLSLATKLEEINCNYISFLNEKVLNSPNEKIFTNKDLTKMEFTILKCLKYKTIYSTPLDFIDIYYEMFSKFLEKNSSFISPEILCNIRNISINIMINNLNKEIYLFNASSHYAYICFVQAINQVRTMNSFYFKQLEKTIFTFNYNFANIF